MGKEKKMGQGKNAKIISICMVLTILITNHWSWN